MKPLSATQKIAIWGIVVPSVISLIGVLFQGRRVNDKLQPVLELKPVINNVINNITKVEKEVANLKEVVKQQYGLWESETFGRRHLETKVRKVNRPATAPETNASFVFIELNKVPLANSLLVSNERGVSSPGTIRSERNIVLIKYLGMFDGVLDYDTDFINVRYIPDWENHEQPYSLKGATLLYECSAEGECKTKFDMSLREAQAGESD